MLDPSVVRTDPYCPFASSFQSYRSVFLCFGPLELAIGDRTSGKFPVPCFSVADSLVLNVLWFCLPFRTISPVLPHVRSLGLTMFRFSRECAGQTDLIQVWLTCRLCSHSTGIPEASGEGQSHTNREQTVFQVRRMGHLCFSFLLVFSLSFPVYHLGLVFLKFCSQTPFFPFVSAQLRHFLFFPH